MWRDDVSQMIDEKLAQHVQERHKGRKGSRTAPEGFEVFWAAWTPKRGKEAAEKAWAKILPGPLLVAQIADAARAQIKAMGTEWSRENHKFQPHASTWLNGKRWLDEIESGKKPKLKPKVVLCACGCRRPADREVDGRMWHTTQCWWEKTHPERKGKANDAI